MLYLQVSVPGGIISESEFGRESQEVQMFGPSFPFLKLSLCDLSAEPSHWISASQFATGTKTGTMFMLKTGVTQYF